MALERPAGPRHRATRVQALAGDNGGVIPEGEALLWAAAVVGVSFRVDLVAEVTGLERLAALDGLVDTAVSPIVRVNTTRGSFVDAAVWEKVYEAVPPSERVRLHGRCAEALIGWIERGRVVDPAEVARHLLASGPSVAERAAVFFVKAGDLAMDEGAYAAAAGHFEHAVAALELADGGDGPRAAALCALGAACLADGHRASSRDAFGAAVSHARRAGRGDLLAQAALGLGSGAAGFEVGLADRAQLDLLEEALVALPSDETALRASVLARLSVALSLVETEERRSSLALEAVELARAAEDPVAVGGALAAQCDALAGPDHAETRRRLATEIVEVARTLRDRELELLGRRHRLVALAETGDVEGVDAEIRGFAALSEVLGQPLYAWYVPLWRGMRALMDGRLADCRRWLDDAAAVGADAGSHNSFLLTTTLRWCLLAETGDGPAVAALADGLDLDEEPGVWAAVASALMAAEAGRLAEARMRLDSAAARLAGAPRDSEWLPMLTQVADLIGHLGGHSIAAWTYEALRPHADRIVVEGIGAALRGSVHRPLGLLAAALGEHQQATAHFTAARDAHRVMGAPLLVARTLRDWGVALDDGEVLEVALAAYEDIGIDARIAEVRAALGTASTAGQGGQRFLKEGDVWSLTYAGASVRLRHSKGLQDIARLLASPVRPIAAVDLAAGVGATGTRLPRDADLHQAGDLGEVVDTQARDAYRRRLRELDTTIEQAEDAGDGERAANAKAERDALVDHLRAAYGLSGRPRRAGDPAERARTAVTGRIRDAIRHIEAAHPELGRHLRRSVRTGTVCVYEPDAPVTWTL